MTDEQKRKMYLSTFFSFCLCSDLLLPSHLPLLPFSKTVRQTLTPSILKLSALHLLGFKRSIFFGLSIIFCGLSIISRVSGVWFTEAGNDVGLRYTFSQWYAWNCCGICLGVFCKATLFCLTRVRKETRLLHSSVSKTFVQRILTKPQLVKI